MDRAQLTAARPETYNPWSVVNLVFHHLAEQGLHPILGGAGDPGAPAAAAAAGAGHRAGRGGQPAGHADVEQHLAEIRAAVFGETDRRPRPLARPAAVSHVESPQACSGL